MGWLFHTTDYGRKAFIEERTRNEENEKTKWECLSFSDKKSHLWKVIRRTDKETNQSITFIALDMIGKERNGGWGYKDLDESCGFYQKDCPKKFLIMTNAPRNEYANKWYAEMNELKPKPKAVKFEAGMKVKLNDGVNVGGAKLSYAILSFKYNKVSWVAEVYNQQCIMVYSRIKLLNRHIKEII